MEDKKSIWLKNLKAGDEVAYLLKTSKGERWAIVKIVKVTPTGRINLPNGYVVNPDGKFRGINQNRIHPVTEKIRKSQEKAHLIIKIERQFSVVDWENATDEKLKAIYELLGTFPIKA